jgi:hypothetical protein
LAVVAAAVAVTACGSGGAGTTADAAVNSANSGRARATLSKALFIKRGDAICTKTESHMSEALESSIGKLTAGGKPLTRAGEEKLVQTITLPLVRRIAEELGGLPPPAGAEKAASSLIHELKAAALRVEKHPAVAFLPTSPITLASANVAAFGFEACSLF